MIVDLMHLVLLVGRIATGAWSLVASRVRLPRGRFAIFCAASIATLFGCAAVGGEEVGLMSQAAWFAVVVAFLGVLAIDGCMKGRISPTWR